MIRFEGKSLVLTGGSGGIGQATAKTFAAAGADVIVSDLDEKSLSAFKENIGAPATRILAFAADVTRMEDCEALMAFAGEKFGGLDFLVNCAGIYPDQLAETMTEGQWQKVLTVNLTGTFHACRSSFSYLRPGGAIVNLASVSGHRGSYAHSHYAASKGGVLGFSRSLAIELAPRIRVNAVSPGIIDTPMVSALLSRSEQQLVESTPLKRLGTAQEVANVIAFLCSDLASFVTGETVHVNGGLYIAS
jgi:3-oxoacyl-[acyl-carrier protein] reductase